MPTTGETVSPADQTLVPNVSPAELTATAIAGDLVTQTFTIHNDSTATLSFEISEGPIIQSHGQVEGVQHHKALGTKPAASNLRSTASRWAPLRYEVRWITTTTPRILLYTDDFFTGPGATYPEQALRHLGLPFVAYYADPDGFLGALHGQDPWDLVLISHNERLAAGAIWPHVEAFIAGGGRAIVETFDIDGSDSAPTGLWSLCGAEPVGDIGDALPVFAWLPGHSFFSQPVYVPLQLAFQNVYLDDGDRLRPLGQARAIAGFSPQPEQDQAAIVLGADGRCLVNSFIISANQRDTNGDGLLDGVALWINELSFVAREWIDIPWLRITPTRKQLAPGDAAEIAVALNAEALQPGDHQAYLIVRTEIPATATGIPVTFRVEPAPDMGRITGLVIDAATGERLHARIRASGTPYVVETSPETGWYNLWLKAGRYTLEASAEGYYPAHQEVDVAANDVISVGFLLRRRGMYLLPIFRNWP